MRLIAVFTFWFYALAALGYTSETFVSNDSIKVERRLYKKLFGGPQRVHLAWVNMNKLSARPIVSNSGCQKLSSIASARGALLAINGTFYTGECRSRNLIKVFGRLSTYNRIRKRGSVALLIGKNQSAHIRIVGRRENPQRAYHAIGGFPQLVARGQVSIQPRESTGFFTRRHPRTAVAVVNAKMLLLITVDGRSWTSAGMTMAELADFVASLGVQSAMNLDGGGSTAMWYQPRGVISTPSDFFGERAVSDGLAVFD